MKKIRLTTLFLAFWLALNPAFAGEGVKSQDDATDLAELDENPVAKLIRLQIEDNVQFGFGPDNGTLNFLRIEPTVAFNLSKRLSLVTRAIFPIVHQPFPQPADGVGEIGLQLFLAPRKKSNLFWGFGPAFVFPSATKEILGTEKWSAGPSAVLGYRAGRWVFGTIVNQLWSYAGADDRKDVNAMTLRPFVYFNFSHGWFLVSSPSIVASWNADDANHLWLIPVGGGVGKLFKLGSKGKGIKTSIEAYDHVKAPAIGPDWQLRFQLTFLFPR
ncbi:MAG TPA: neuromedin U [bacterium]|nr:neuromedin U [bacterium]